MGIESLITLIGVLVPIVNNIVSFINLTAATLRQSAELTPEQVATLDGHIEQLKIAPEEYQKEQPL
jgi:hypothetical protein